VVNLCPKNWNIKPRTFRSPRNTIERFFKIENPFFVEIIIKIPNKDAKANLMNKRSKGFENLKAYLIIGKEVLHRKEEISNKIKLSIFLINDYIIK
jgi:hypothetical protein